MINSTDQSPNSIAQPPNAITRSPNRKITQFVAFLASLLTLSCGSPPQAVPAAVAASRPLGAWEGSGNRTIGITSDSGRFRVKWETTAGPAPGGSFRLVVHSAVSGRPIQVIADHQGAGAATVDFADDPRPYNLMIDSAGVQWSVSVDEIVAGRVP